MRDSFRIIQGSEKKLVLKSEYVRIDSKGGQLYGGDQSAFGGLIKETGCGLIAMADISLYLSGKTHLSSEEYESYVRDFNEKYVRLRKLPGAAGKKFGMCSIDGRSSLLLKRCFRKNNADFSARMLSVPVCRRSDKTLTSCKCFRLVAGAVSADKPVILGVGPSESHKLPLYVRTNESSTFFVRKNSTSGHYVTITGVSVCSSADTKEPIVLFRISSWGKKYYIDLKELYEHISADRGIIGFLVGRISNNLTIVYDKK